MLYHDINWLKSFIKNRLEFYFKGEPFVANTSELYDQQKNTSEEADKYQKICSELKFNIEEKLILLICLAPHVKPEIFDFLRISNSEIKSKFSEFGGKFSENPVGFTPTIQTIFFLVYGGDIEKLPTLFSLLDESNPLIKENILKVNTNSSDIFLNHTVTISEEIEQKVIFKKGNYSPRFNTKFPAKKLTRDITLDQLILSETIKNEIDLIEKWLQVSQNQEAEDLGGFKTLFYGPPGTGKSVTASALGIKYNIDVYRIDSSQLVSKYIGETEQNLKNLFDIASNKNWILFFDEADSLFSKRTEVNTSNDRFANQQTNYLLQLVEDYNGLVVLATNNKPNMDKAFVRRFSSMIFFGVPNNLERKNLWESYLPKTNTDQIDLSAISMKYQFTGGTIKSACDYLKLKFFDDPLKIQTNDLEEACKRELKKYGKSG